MTDQSDSTRRLTTPALTRVEGEGAMHVVIRDDELVDVELNIYEPPRFFEGFLRGRGYEEPVDITARICGICPVAYQMSACAALEDAWDVAIPEPIATLRRALYCGEWIESHVLHMVLLHLPDFLGVDSVVEVADVHPDVVRDGLAAKKAGNALVTMLGGREIHPVNVKVGGFYRLPRRHERDAMVAQLRAVRQPMEDLVRWMGRLDFPSLEVEVPLVALRPPETYPFVEGPIATSTGLVVAPREWSAHFAEEHVERSNALHARLHGEPYLTGPLADPRDARWFRKTGVVKLTYLKAF